MLQTGGPAITQVAYACGFNDSNYFSTVFKQHIGLSPRQFLQQAARR